MFLNKAQNATNSVIGLIIFIVDLAVIIGIPAYTLVNGSGIIATIVMFFISLFIISPIATYLLSFIGAIIMATWTSITDRKN